jgi:hypothetical protein
MTLLAPVSSVSASDSAAASPAAAASSAPAAAAPAAPAADAAAAVPPADFWTGLSAFLEAQYGAAGGKAVATALDNLHYASVRALNYEDIEDLSKMLAAELQLDAAAAPAAE